MSSGNRPSGKSIALGPLDAKHPGSVLCKRDRQAPWRGISVPVVKLDFDLSRVGVWSLGELVLVYAHYARTSGDLEPRGGGVRAGLAGVGAERSRVRDRRRRLRHR